MTRHWKTHLWWNTATNYLRMVLRIISGILVFRLLYQHFSAEQFGYWSLLWSVFGYTILLDFGMGYTAEREVAHCTATGEWDRLNRLLSTMVWSFIGLGLVVVLVFILIHSFFLNSIHISPENRTSFSWAYWIFFGALALAFPLGVFSEMLVGLQRVDLLNWTGIVSSLINLGMVFAAIHYHWPFETFVFVAVITSLTPNFFAYFMVRRLIPQLSLKPQLFHFPSVRAVLSFSLVAYVIKLTSIIVTQTDQLVISMCIGVAFVTVYQAGYKVSEIFGMFTQQMQGALDPVAAHLRAKGDETSLRVLLMTSTRLIALISTPGYALAAVYLDSLIKLVTGLDEVNASTFWVGQILLFHTYSTLLTSSCAKPILLMCGWEKPLLKRSLANALVNLALSILLVYKFGVVGVALGTLMPGVLIGWFGILPLALKFAKTSFSQWAREIYLPIFAPVGLSLIILLVATQAWALPSHASFLGVIVRSIVIMLPVGIYLIRIRKQLFHI